ncbi:hypothetical protein SELMODRAFT_405136 [Selaginella moellendorffii]|uniref:Phytocyanin domain-containing protein n=2 Tax=Selaginella moellendorffii TaxID=88036 RepID=D8QYI7_SELML|nr:hypothetical protein SELMODRAFT_405136 [Selaginella moellendorffii]
MGASKQERGNAAVWAIAMAILLARAAIASAYMIYRVGDDDGWTANAPGIDYTKWASQKAFQVGDMLVFAYSGANHTVLQTSSQDAFDACNTGVEDAKIWSADGSSSSNVMLTTPGRTYFLCTADDGGHCRAGMKFGIDVTGTAPSAGSDGLVAPTGSPPVDSSWNSPGPVTDFSPPFLTPDPSSSSSTGSAIAPPGSITTPSENSNSPLYSRATPTRMIGDGFEVAILVFAAMVL